ncbi:MAG: hypothetical protein JXR25_06285 [Pontiellaceae bacterium]|nr:hypothetical protein [Pontiellaceae bacterium]MBN2784417.1 hypothetical protein [Pontiellaceae bacterium]
MINLNYSRHSVIQVSIFSDDLFELSVERNGLEFLPGDCVALYTDEAKSRPYSIASGTNEEDLRFVIRSMKDGEVSPWLMNRKPGDEIRISPPFGWFRPGQDIGDAPFVFMATGTGVAPFLSYLNTFEKVPTKVLYGVRTRNDAIGFDRFNRRGSSILAVSREPSKDHFQGRITGLLDSLSLDGTTHYYCCGLESMVNEVSAWLQGKGIGLPQIHREVFFHG